MHSPGTCTCCDFSYYDASALYIESQLEDLDDEKLKGKLTPRGANRSVSSEPDAVEIDEAEIDAAIELFEDLMTDLADLLYALPVGVKPTDGDELFEDLSGDWEWYYEEYYYHETEAETEIDEAEKDRLSLGFIDFYLDLLLESTASLILEEITIQSWVKTTRARIRNSTVAEYLLGIGGKNVVDISDIDALKALIKAQWTYFQKFAEEIKSGELSGARILQRIGMYGEAITHGYEQAKAKSHGIVLPEYPADGNQQCFMNCRCHWELKDDTNDGNYVLATWKLNPSAEHCTSCVDNSRTWNPLRVKKQ